MKKTFEKQLGENIREARRNKVPRVSLEKLARLTGISRVTINNVELGKVPNVGLVTIIEIARALEVPIAVLVGEEEMSGEAIRTMDLVKALIRKETKAKEPKKKK